MATFQPPPTYAEVLIKDERSGKPVFNPIWLKWFVDMASFVSASGNPGGGGFVTVTALGGSAGSSLVGFIGDGAGTVARTAQDKMRDFVSVKDFGCLGNGTDEFTKILAAWTYCLANGKSLYFPPGIYSSGVNNMPFKQAAVPVVTLLDCQGITIFGAGRDTVLRSDSVSGADVLQLNGLKNITFRDFMITATLSGSSAGSNGISVTGGFDNITLNNLWIENLPSLDKTTYVDGGKALSIQEDGTPNLNTIWGRLTAQDLHVLGCAMGFDYEPSLTKIATSPAQITIDMEVKDSYIAHIVASGAAAGALTQGMSSGIRISGTCINCQKDFVGGRVHGGNINLSIVTTKTAAARRLNPLGVAWRATDTTVIALDIEYAKNNIIRMAGDKGGCDYKAKIGYGSPGSSGLNGATEFCDIYLDISGTSTTADIFSVVSGADSMASSHLKVTKNTTAAALPADFFTAAKNNTLEYLGAYGQSLCAGNVRFPTSQIPSSDVNTLDDYTEGTWLPVLADTGLVAKGATYSLQTGNFTKIGDTIRYTCALTVTGLGTLIAGSAAFLLGLPYTSANVSGNISSGSLSTALGLNLTAGDVACASIGTNTNYIELRKWPAAGTAGTIPMLISEVSATGTLVISGQYKSAT